MKSYVVDASVILKWIFRSNDNEDHTENALNLLKLIALGECQVVQPTHWLAEVAAVVCRLEPIRSDEIIISLSAMNFTISDELDIYHLAAKLSSKYQHHLFNTLYHALAIALPHAVFITADNQYYKKARSAGSIMFLADFM